MDNPKHGIERRQADRGYRHRGPKKVCVLGEDVVKYLFGKEKPVREIPGCRKPEI